MHDDGIDAADDDWLRRKLQGRLRPWIEWFGLARLAGGVLVVVLVVAGGYWLLRSPAPPTEARLPYAAGAGATSSTGPTSSPASAPSDALTATTSSSTSTSTSTPTGVVVHVAGAVTMPGVYHLEAGARVVDAVAAAGGTNAEADPAALNLAALLVDGERVYVLEVGEEHPPPPPPRPPPGPQPSAAGSTAPAGPIDVNRATVDELVELPGVGPATAAAIVAHRDERGPFASVDDLDAVSGIGPAKLDALRDLVTT